MRPLLTIEGLELQFSTREGLHKALRGVSLSINEGETLGLVGESGSGKSVTALAVMGLLASPFTKFLGGSIVFSGASAERDLLKIPQNEMRKLRGNEIAMVFQEPFTSLNPIHSCGKQLAEPLILHKGMSKDEARRAALELLEKVGIPDPSICFKEYPHQLSGGMRQRVMIAMALACKPKLLIADEPTTALDVTIQAQILELMKELRRETGSAILLITHDLGVVGELCDRAAVMYAGEIVESCTVDELFAGPLHPYSRGLLYSIPNIKEKRDRLYAIEGTVPNPFEMPEGCAFAPRCPQAGDICRVSPPPNMQKNGRMTRCHMGGAA
jgi:oligopeptide/dipeptide ABC transporter ATP-binding protein